MKSLHREMASARQSPPGCYFPPRPSIEDGHAVEQVSAKPKRSLTPRGPLFLNFDEAHRNITSKLHPTNPFRKHFDGSQTSDDIPLIDFSSPNSPESDSKMVQDRPQQNPIDFVLPRLTIRYTEGSLTNRADLPGGSTRCDFDVVGTEPEEDLQDASKEVQHPDTSDSTVDNILNQYDRRSDRHSSSLDDMNAECTFPSANEARLLDQPDRHGVASRVGFLGERSVREIGRRKNQAMWSPHISARTPARTLTAQVQQACSHAENTVLESPFDALPGRPVEKGSHPKPNRGQDLSSAPQAAVVSTSQDLLSQRGYHEEPRLATRSLFPSPLCVPSSKEQLRNGPSSDEMESSAGWDASTESTDEPFKYDSERYRRILNPTSAREVSQALERIVSVESATEDLLDHPNMHAATARRQETWEEQGHLQVSKDELADSHDDKPQRNKKLISSMPLEEQWRPQGSFFDLDELHKVQLQHGESDGLKVVIDRQKVPKNPGIDQVFNSQISKRDESTGCRLPQGLTSDGDWITEATSDAGFGAEVVSTRPMHHVIKPTGSSIADFSDDDYGRSRHDVFGSHERILQHPSDDLLHDGYEVRNLKDTQQRVFLPRSHINRINGFAQNSIRLRPDLAKPEGSSFSRKLLDTNPFRRQSYQRAGPSSHFTYKSKAPSKYDFRDSMSSYAPVAAGIGTAKGTHCSLPSTGSQASVNTSEILNVNPFSSADDSQLENTEEQPEEVDLRLISTKSSYGDDAPTPVKLTICESSSTGKFSFPLIDLRQAQTIHKIRRESGDVDETESSAARYKRARSNASDRASGSVTPRLPRIPPIFRRENASGFRSSTPYRHTPPNWQRIPGDVIETPTPAAGGAHTTSSMTATTESVRQISTFSRTPDTPATYTTSDTPTATKTGWYGRYPSRLVPKERRPGRNCTNRTLESFMRDDAEHGGQDYRVSYKAHSRRKCWFHLMVFLSLLPFFAPIVLWGVFDDALSWLTNGEVSRLTRRQRRVIKIMFLLELILYTASVAGIVVYFVTRYKFPQ